MASALPMEPARRYTVDDLNWFPEDGKFRELVDGRIVKWDMPNLVHSFLMGALTELLRRFAREHRLGKVFPGDGMVRILGSRYDARGADIAFYRRDRVPKDMTQAATSTAPDLVIEILSPSDRAGDVQEKIHDWLRAGVRLLWYINPETGDTTVYNGSVVSHVAADDILDGADVLPGLRIRLRDILTEMERDNG